MATLLLLNGPPGIGKSTAARAYLARDPEARCVEVDRLRMQIEGWEDDESTKLVARDLALSAVAESLEEGRDVLVPQFLGRPDFIAALAGTAQAVGARFIHVVLSADLEVVQARFEARRRELGTRGAHPEREVEDVTVAITAAAELLTALDDVVAVPAGEIDDVVARLRDLVRG